MKISNTKIYEQVADIILESIKSGEYKVEIVYPQYNSWLKYTVLVLRLYEKL